MPDLVCYCFGFTAEDIQAAASAVTEEVLLRKKRSLRVSELCEIISEELDMLHPVARLRFDLEWKRIDTLIGGVVEVALHMKRDPAYDMLP